MQIRPRCWILVTIGLLTLLNLAPSMDIRAQETQSLLVIGRSGELWSWSGTGATVTQLTFTTGNVGQFSRSPDGNKIAYKVVPANIIKWITKEIAAGAGDGAFEGQLPQDIRILDLESHKDTLIAGQSPLNPQSPLGKGSVKRSTPSWSPDGHSLVWLEDSSYEKPSPTPNASQGSGEFVPSYHLIIYDDVSGVKNDIVLDLGWAGTPLWGQLGIVLRGQDDAFLYNEKGKLQATFRSRPISPVLWVKDGSNDYVAIRSDFDKSGGWYYFDVTDGEIADISGQLEMYSLTAPDGFSIVQETDDFLLKFWEVLHSGDVVKEITVEADLLENSHTPFYTAFGISPDGLGVAYSNLRADLEAHYNNVYVLRGDTSKTLELTEDNFVLLAWGPVGWRIRHSYSKPRDG